MKTIEIKSKEGEVLIAQELTVELNQLIDEAVEITSPDYMVMLERDGLELKVTNAVNGYGHNCRELFKNATVNIY